MSSAVKRTLNTIFLLFTQTMYLLSWYLLLLLCYGCDQVEPKTTGHFRIATSVPCHQRKHVMTSAY